MDCISLFLWSGELKTQTKNLINFRKIFLKRKCCTIHGVTASYVNETISFIFIWCWSFLWWEDFFFFELQSVLVPHHILAVVTVSMTAGIVSSNKLAVYEEWWLDDKQIPLGTFQFLDPEQVVICICFKVSIAFSHMPSLNSGISKVAYQGQTCDTS